MGALKTEYLPRYTYEDYLRWEDNWELIYGIPYAMSPAPLIKHQNISNKIARYLDEAFQECKHCQALLPIDWKISDETILQPDNLVICHEPEKESYIKKAPVIIFEVLSKSTAKKDLHVKYEIYEQEGVKYYIIVDPEEELAKVYELKNGHYAKLCDTKNDKVIFEVEKCSEQISFDFSKIWA